VSRAHTGPVTGYRGSRVMMSGVSHSNVYEVNVASVTNQWTTMILTSFAASFFVTFVVSFLGLLDFCEFSETVLITACSLQSSLSSDDVYNNHQHLQLVAKNSTSSRTVVCISINNSLLCLHIHDTATRPTNN